MALLAEYTAGFHAHRFSAVVLDRTVRDMIADYRRPVLGLEFQRDYPLRVQAIGADDIKFGLQPRWIYLPCSQSEVARKIDPQLNLLPCSK
jgi:hypothetical protein